MSENEHEEVKGGSPQGSSPGDDATLNAHSPGQSQAQGPGEDDSLFSQADLDTLFDLEEARLAEAEAAEKSALGQDAIDALLNANLAQTPASRPDEVLGGQKDPDALVSSEQDSLPQESLSETGIDAGPSADSPFGQDDIDALITSEAPSGGEAVPASPAGSSETEISELEAMLDKAIDADGTPLSEAKAAPVDAGIDAAMDQAAIDALLNGQTQEPPPAADGGDLDQAAIDALMGLGGEDAAPADADAAMDQAAIDALLNGGPQEPAPVADDGELDQAAIDALMGGGAQEAAPVADADAAMDQAAIDALLNGGAQEPAPAADGGDLDQAAIDALMGLGGEDAAQADADAAMDQAAIDALLNGGPQEPAPAADDGELDQAAIDALMGGGTQEPAPAADDGELDQAAIDALLNGAAVGGGVSGQDQEAPGDEEKAAMLEQSELDALLSGFDDEEVQLTEEPAAAEEEAPAAAVDEASLSQDMIDALVASAGDEEKAKEITHSPPPQEKESAEGLLTQEDLDAMVTQAAQEQRERQAAKQKALSQALESRSEAKPEKEAKPKKERKPVIGPVVISLAGVLQENAAKLAVSLAAAVVVAFGTFTFLYTHQERTPDPVTLAQLETRDLIAAMQAAERLIDMGSYGSAVDELDRVIPHAPPSPERADAEFLRAEAAYKGLTRHSPRRQVDTVHDLLNELIEKARSHPRAAEVLRWKAQLYERDSIPYAALDTYRRVMANYGNAPNLDQVLMDAARLALRLKRPEKAAEYTTRLLEQFPASPLASRAKLLLADAYAAGGDLDQARVLYGRIAQAEPNTRIGGQAFARLGQLAYDAGRYDDAIRQIEQRLETATTVEGNEQVYLLLARVYRAKGNLEGARRTLNDLLDFFPESEITPEALVELSQVLDEMGKRPEAIRVARQGVQSYPKNVAVLRNHGQLLSEAGRPQEAAQALLSASEAGASGQEPALLLQAARHFKKAEALDDAEAAYARVVREFPSAPEAFEASIELAQVMYESGKVRRAVRLLENLVLSSEGTPERLPALIALGNMYRDLGLKDRASTVFQQVTRASSEPEVLAKAAIAFWDADEVEQGLITANRVDVAKLTKPTAYSFLMRRGKAYLRIDSQKASRTMEQAYLNYPAQRRIEDGRLLLDTYLAAGEMERARALIMDLRPTADTNPQAYRQAIIAWGDALYERGTYQDAAAAYSLALEAYNVTDDDAYWAKYQRANALFNLADYAASVDSFEEVAASSAPWAAEAGLKAEQAKLALELNPSPKREVEENMAGILESV